MAGGDPAIDGRRVVYCVVPGDLAGKLHEPLREFFADRADVEVIVERRVAERRAGDDRRTAAEPEPSAALRLERRTAPVSAAGRRSEDRRGAVEVVPALPLPRSARRYAERLVFIERVEPATQEAEDSDAAGLVARFQGGDTEAFGLLYLRYFDRVYNYLRFVLGDPQAAQDATQQVFVNALRSIDRYRPTQAPFRGWLFSIARNHAISHLRKEQRVEPMDPSKLNDRMESRAPDPQSLDALNWISDPDLLVLLERLSLPQRQVLVMRYMLDLTHKEIATILDRSPADVRKLQQRAQDFLRARLAAIGRRSERQESPQRMRARRPHDFNMRQRRYALLP